MKQILLVLVPIVIFGVLITGGLQITDPQKVGPVSMGITDLVDQGFNAEKTLQIGVLGHAGAITPTPTLPAGTTPAPTTGPAPTTPPFATQPPIPTNRPTPTPTSPPQCKGQSIVLDLLIDESGTMQNASRISEVKIAIKKLASYLRPDDVIGIQSFSSPRSYGGGSDGSREILSLNTYANNKASLSSKVDTMGTTGDTHILDGFKRAKNVINAGLSSFAGKKWIFIVMSDGVPNDQNVPGDGPDQSQDPRPFNQQINGLVSRVISVWMHPGEFSGNQASYGQGLMSSLVSGPGVNYYPAQSAGDIAAVWDQLDRSVCGI